APATVGGAEQAAAAPDRGPCGGGRTRRRDLDLRGRADRRDRRRHRRLGRRRAFEGRHHRVRDERRTKGSGLRLADERAGAARERSDDARGVRVRSCPRSEPATGRYPFLRAALLTLALLGLSACDDTAKVPEQATLGPDPTLP